MTYIKMW